MADWPSTIPQAFIQDSFSETQQGGVIRTTMDTGPAKVRRRFTATSTYWEGYMVMTYSELEIFKTFYETTIAYGSLRFNFPNQYNLASTVESRIVIETSGTPFKVRPDGLTQDFQVSFKLEVFDL
jgi:hypothetical protein